MLTTGLVEGWITGFEPATSGITIRRSNQLSYTHHVSQFFLATQSAAKVRYLTNGKLRLQGSQISLGVASAGLQSLIRNCPEITLRFGRKLFIQSALRKTLIRKSEFPGIALHQSMLTDS